MRKYNFLKYNSFDYNVQWVRDEVGAMINSPDSILNQNIIFFVDAS